MKYNDIRWQQRFSNFKKALSQLKKFVDEPRLNEMEEQGMIQTFEYTFELAWNVMKDYYEYQGVADLQGSRDVIRLAFKRNLIEDGEDWMKMIESRIKSSHTYQEEIAKEIVAQIREKYFDLFCKLEQKLTAV